MNLTMGFDSGQESRLTARFIFSTLVVWRAMVVNPAFLVSKAKAPALANSQRWDLFESILEIKLK